METHRYANIQKGLKLLYVNANHPMIGDCFQTVR
jgi:hypothetical protein